MSKVLVTGRKPYRVLAVGGSDSGGSAGIQADLKTLEARGVFGTSALTTVTAQNTLAVQQAFPLPVELVAAQMDSVLGDIGADAIKTGLLGRAEVVAVVAERAARLAPTPLVVDPVLINGQGRSIVSQETVVAYRRDLFPLAAIITPNLNEASWLAEIETISRPADLYEAARRLRQLGPQTVLVKGGHLGGETVIDLYYDGEQFMEFTAPRLPLENPHGVGCTFASAIAAELAKGASIETAVKLAHVYLQDALRGALGWRLGAGRSPVNHRVNTG
jgi:hydroxymethylpyrimidine/phosphomethylpyrimidine kinase